MVEMRMESLETRFVYADNAATTSLGAAAKEAMLPYFDQWYANPSSHHRAGAIARKALHEARVRIATSIGAQDPSEIVITSGGSESDNQAVATAALIGERSGRRHIVSTAIEHHAILHALDRLKAKGFEVDLVGVNSAGLVSLEDIKAAVRPDTVLVSVMMANNEIGTIQPIERIGRFCRERGVLFHTDAVQAVGHIPLDVAASNVDLLSLSAHKFHGPKGVGALYVRDGIEAAVLIAGGGQERGRRAGTENVGGVVGMAAALQHAVDNLPRSVHYVLELRERLIAALLEIPGARLNGSPSLRLPGNVNVGFEGVEGESALILLDQRGIAASVGSACDSSSKDPSHVLLALGLTQEQARGSLRLTIDETNTSDEIDYLIDSVSQVIGFLRSVKPAWA